MNIQYILNIYCIQPTLHLPDPFVSQDPPTDHCRWPLPPLATNYTLQLPTCNYDSNYRCNYGTLELQPTINCKLQLEFKLCNFPTNYVMRLRFATVQLWNWNQLKRATCNFSTMKLCNLPHFFSFAIDPTYMKRILHFNNITFKSSYDWFKIDIHQQLWPLTANYLAMFKVISTTIYT